MFELPPTYFSDLVAAVRRERDRRGGDLADLARGNPEVPPPRAVLEAASAAMLEPTLHGYPPFAGLPELREAFVAHQRDRFGVDLDPDREVLVVPGTKTAITLVCMAFAGQGGEVLVPDPGYADYPGGVALAGARLRWMRLDPAASWAPDFESVGKLEPGERMAFLNYPANPIGCAAPKGVFTDAVAWANRTGTVLVHDHAYGELGFGQHDAAPSMLAEPGAKDVGLELVSMSKTYCMAGWRVGFVCGGATLIDSVRTFLDHMTVGVPMPIQRGVAAALTGPQDSVREVAGRYERRCARVKEALGPLVRELHGGDGGYYTWLLPPVGIDFEMLLHEHGVALAPGEGFGPSGRGWLRLSVAVSDAELELGLERLARAFAGS